jgi:hypothetical protein
MVYSPIYAQKNYIISSADVFKKNYNFWKTKISYFPEINKYEEENIDKYRYSFKYWSEKYYLMLISTKSDNCVKSISLTVNIKDPKYKTYFKSSVIASILSVDTSLKLKQAIDVYMDIFRGFKLKNGNKNVCCLHNFMYTLLFQNNTIVFFISKYKIIK